MKILSYGPLLLLNMALLNSGHLCADEPVDKDQSLSSDKTTQPNESAPTYGTELFEKKILPVLVAHCYECHSKSNDTMEGGLEVDSRAGLASGGDSGPLLQAHDAGKSPLLKMLRHVDEDSAMPPDEKLPDEVIAAFEEWINLGAPDSRTDTGKTAKEQRLIEAKQHWSFQPPQHVESPEVDSKKWAHDSMIDNFVLARMESQGLKPAPDASRQTLIRRLSYDLIGLPPSPQDIDAFVANTSPDAVEQLVDRLLDSPQFGERWGRHWMDVVRFAESSGMEFNFTYPHAWPFRDYVIDSFNADKPFDLFLREQIAGDLMPDQEGESEDDLQARKIAPSMLAFGPKRHNSSGTEFQINIADDQIEVVTKSTMALTVACARCHDHKFDPIPTRDYYALAGIFLSTEPLYGTIKQKYSNTPTDLVPIGANAQALHLAAETYEKKITELEKLVADKDTQLAKAVEAAASTAELKLVAERKLAKITAEQTLAGGNSKATAQTTVEEQHSDEAKQIGAGKLDGAESTLEDSTVTDTSDEPLPNNSKAVATEQSEDPATLPAAIQRLAALKSSVAALETGVVELQDATKTWGESTARVALLKDEIAKQNTSVGELKKNRPARPQYAMSVRDRAKPTDTKLAIRGDFRTRGDVVPRGFLTAVDVQGARPVDTQQSGRLELAEWITSPDNPLTARVMVNRIWHHMFGRGIVPTVDNFGLIGKPPSHPELLDGLALRFIHQGWSVKRMIRAIALSRTYQLSCTVDEASIAIDPGNRLLWRATPRRLEAEAIRDAILAVSGQIDLSRPNGSTVTALGDKLARSISTDRMQPANNHRSVYLPVVRDYVPELFDLFDFPSPSLVSGGRATTNVPSQALYLRNSAFIAEQAEHAAQRLLDSAEASDDEARIALSMRWALGRVPTKIEHDAALRLVSSVQQSEVSQASETNQNAEKPDQGLAGVDAWSSWFLTLFTTAEFRYLVDIE